MTSRRKGPTPRRPWGPWMTATEVFQRGTGEVRTIPEGEQFVTNNIFNVHMTRLKTEKEGSPDLIWLSICRKDRKPIRDWRHMQRIKNELVGPECEGMEMYPAESRLVDTSNQYHLWVFDDPTFRWPWGYKEREVMDADHPEIAAAGAVQRPFEESA